MLIKVAGYSPDGSKVIRTLNLRSDTLYVFESEDGSEASISDDDGTRIFFDKNGFYSGYEGSPPEEASSVEEMIAEIDPEAH